MKNTPSIAQLQLDWTNLHDLDRAATVRSLNESGLSIRKIASSLNKSESSLRRLLIALDAPAEDRLLARQGKISTNELVRRSEAAELKRDARAREETVRRQEEQAVKASVRICRWLRAECICGGNAEQVIEEVRRELYMTERQGRLKQPMKKANASIARIIELSKPKFAMGENAEFITWYAAWLFRWALSSFVDPVVRDKALDLAVQKQ